MHSVAAKHPHDSRQGPAPVRLPDPDRTTLEALVRRHQAGVWRYLRTLGSSPDLADDVTQETFLVAHGRGLTGLQPEAVGAFLRTTARFLYLRTVRTAKRRAEILADAADVLWAQDCGDDDGDRWLDALRACVAGLEGRARQALALFYGENLGRAEVAARLDMRENGVKTLLHRARIALRACVRRRLT